MRGPLAERLKPKGLLKLDKMAETIEAFALLAASAAYHADHAQAKEPLLAVLPFDNFSGDPEMQFFSDGVTDAQNAEGEEFGEDRLLEVLRGASGGRADEIIGAVFDALERFVGAAAQFDDITMLVVRRE